jgi:acyl-CoA synthetase (AMP-forming)/AMP-acid ligase II
MLPNVASCHVDAVSNGRGGEVVRARVVPLEGRPVTRRDVIEQCRQQLAEYKLPRVIEFLETSPANLAGKILRDRPPESGPAGSS